MLRVTSQTELVAAVLLAATSLLAGCRQNPRQREATFLQKGRSYAEQGDYSRAILEFRNAAAVMPGDPEPYYQIGLADLKSNNVREAIRMLQKAVSLSTNHAGARLKLAELLLVPNHQELAHRAKEHIEQVLFVNPADPDALFFMGITQMELGQAGEAEKAFDEILSKSPQNLRTAVALARLKIGSKDTAAAEAVLKKVVRESPGSAHAATVLGVFYVATGRDQLAEVQFRSALQIDPKYAPCLIQLAQLQGRQGRQEIAAETYKTISTLPDKEYRSFYGMYLLRQGKTQAAIAEFERLYRIDSQDRTTRNRLIAAYLYANRVPDAQKILDAVLARNPKDIDALMQRGEIHLRNGNIAEAKKDIEGVLHFEPNSGLGHYLMAVIDQGEGLTSLQRSELATAVKLAPNLLRARLDLANLFVEAHDAKSAMDTLDSVPAFQKDSLPVVVARNWALIGGGDYKAARKAVDEALAKSNTSELLVQDGVLKVSEKNYAGARSVLEKVLKDKPGDVRALRLLSQSYALGNNRPDEIQVLRRHATLHPDSVATQLVLAASLLESGQYDEARTILTKSKVLEPKSVDVDLMLARVDVDQGKLVDARQRLRDVVSSNPQNISALLMLGMIEESTQQTGEAAEQYRRIVSLDKRNIIALNNLAGALARDPAQVDEALQYARNAKELAPENTAVCDTLGWIYYRKGLYPQAKTELETALRQDARPAIQYHLGLTYLRTGDSERGKELVAAALRANPKLVQTEGAP
jgi:tetratricopeptide (TPR) repeat protein